MTSRILLAEDNESLVTLLRQVLVGQGYQVSTARTGAEALLLLEREQPDLLVLDLRLPELSGVEVLRKIRATPRWQALPVVVMTGQFRGEKYAAAARRLGVRHYLEKPFTREAFLDAIRESAGVVPAGQTGQSLLDLILDIYKTGRSGVLTISGVPPVFFAKGEPCSFLARGEAAFPAFLVAKRKISPEDQRLFLESRDERLFFTQAGILSYEELIEESRLFLAACLVRSLAETDNFAFSEGTSVGELPLVPLSVPRLIYDAAKHHPAVLRSGPFLADAMHRYPTRTTAFYRRANLTTMRKEDIDLLARMDGKQTIGQLLAGAAAGEGGGHFFHFLYLLGMVALNEAPAEDALPDFPQKAQFNKPLEEEERVPEEAAVGFDDLVAEVSGTVAQAVGDDGIAAPLTAGEIDFEQGVQRDYTFIKDKDYYELFGMTRGSFSFDALKKAYFDKTRHYSPERFMELSGATQSLAQEILSVYSHAYGTLSSVVSKERYDEMLNADTAMTLDGRKDDELQARIQFQSGSVFLEMGEYGNAEKALQEAYTLEPENSRHCAFLAWAIYRNPVNRSSRAALDKARSLLTRSLQLEKTAEAFSFRGWMLLDEGRDGLAEGEFLKALKLNPKEMNARRGIRQIAERRESEKKGILRRLFG